MKKVLGLLFALVILLASAVGTGIAETDATTVDREALIGTWVFTIADDSGEEGFLVLNEDETCRLGTDGLMYDMNWTLDGNVLSFVLPDIGIEAYHMTVAVDKDVLTFTEDSGAVTNFRRMDGQSETANIESDSEAEAFLGEWDMTFQYGGTARITFGADGLTDIPMDLDGVVIHLHTRWNYADGILFFPVTGMYIPPVIGESNGNMQVFFEGERIVLIDDFILNDTVVNLGLGFENRNIYVLSRPDNPLTEEEFQALQEKYAVAPEAESDAAE